MANKNNKASKPTKNEEQKVPASIEVKPAKNAAPTKSVKKSVENKQEVVIDDSKKSKDKKLKIADVKPVAEKTKAEKKSDKKNASEKEPVSVKINNKEQIAKKDNLKKSEKEKVDSDNTKPEKVKKEKTNSEKPKAEKPLKDKLKVEKSKAEKVVKEKPKVAKLKAEKIKIEEPKVEKVKSKAEKTKVEKEKDVEPIIEMPKTEKVKAEKIKVEAVKVEKPKTEKVKQSKQVVDSDFDSDNVIIPIINEKVNPITKPSTSAPRTVVASTPPPPPLPKATLIEDAKKPAVIIAHRRPENADKMPKEPGSTMISYQPDTYRSILDEPEQIQGPNYRYSDEELIEFRELITNRLESARKELTYLQGLITRKDEAGTEDTENRFMHMEDGSGAMEREQLAQLASRQIQFISHLEKAMVRIENKTYGICRVTGKLIDKARLRAVPHATLSIEAKKMMASK